MYLFETRLHSNKYITALCNGCSTLMYAGNDVYIL